MTEPTLRPPRPAPLALLAFGNFVIGMGAFVVIGTLVPIADGLRLSKAEAGWVMTAYALSYAVASPVLVALTGAISRRTVLTIGMVTFTLAAILCALAPNGLMLFLARALAAAGAGIYTPNAAAVAVATAAPEARGRALSTVFAGLTLAQVTGVPVGAWVGYAHGWQAAFWIVGGLGTAAAIALALNVPGAVAFQPSSLRQLGRTLLDPLASLSILFTATFLAPIYIVYTYLGPLLEAKLGLGRDGVTMLLAIYGFGAVAGNVLSGRLVDRLGPYRALAICVATQVVLLPMVSFASYPMAFGAMLMVAWSASGWSFMAAQQLRLVSLRKDGHNVLLALNAACIYVGAAVGSAIGGAVLERGGLASLGLAAAGCMLIAGAHLVGTEWLRRRETGRD
ncbi:MAG: MFS transporter [Hyphomicrobiaceae bacterium]|nr:MFS transporter [Hyphomicrobiaceae bacterium]